MVKYLSWTEHTSSGEIAVPVHYDIAWRAWQKTKLNSADHFVGDRGELSHFRIMEKMRIIQLKRLYRRICVFIQQNNETQVIYS